MHAHAQPIEQMRQFDCHLIVVLLMMLPLLLTRFVELAH
jgi:hypothetical protein